MSFKEILKKQRPTKVLPVVVPEWDDATFYLRVLNAQDRIALGKVTAPLKHDIEVAYHTVAYCLCDEQGEPILTYPEDIAILRERESDVLVRLMWKAFELNALGTSGIEAAKKN